MIPTQSPEPSSVGAGSSAVAVRAVSRRWLSFFSLGLTTLYEKIHAHWFAQRHSGRRHDYRWLPRCAFGESRVWHDGIRQAE